MSNYLRFREYVDTMMATDAETHVQTSSYKPHSEQVHFALRNSHACASVLEIKIYYDEHAGNGTKLEVADAQEVRAEDPSPPTNTHNCFYRLLEDHRHVWPWLVIVLLALLVFLYCVLYIAKLLPGGRRRKSWRDSPDDVEQGMRISSSFRSLISPFRSTSLRKLSKT